jgi:hypothetical protein
MAITAPTVDGIVSSTRNMLRDFPIFFETDLGPVNVSTIRLPHPNVDARTLQVYAAVQPGPDTVSTETVSLSAVPTNKWAVDERNGLLKFVDNTYMGKRIFISGYHFQWFIDSDLAFYVGLVVDEHMHNRFPAGDGNLDQISPVELDVIAIGAIVKAIWSLMTEFSTDIDVASPEGMSIPAHQRFQQLWQMLQHWEGIYSDRTKILNVGLGNIDIFSLRRVAYMTNRYVPIYRSQEYDDHNAPVRIRPEIPVGLTSAPGPADGSGVEVADVEEIGRASVDFGFGEWQTLGTSGTG